MRIGILAHGFISWGGGIDFLRGLTSSLHHSGATVELHFLSPTLGPPLTSRQVLRHPYRVMQSLLGRDGPSRNGCVEASHVRELAAATLPPMAVHEIHSGSGAIARKARQLSLDVLIPAMNVLPADFPLPWVGYIYDFQHRYLPQLFEPAECERRNAHFSAMLYAARAVIVNARTVAADAARFHPESRARVFALPFNAAPQPAWLERRDSPASRYGVRNPYFIICNQFWKHKDHATAFEAFAGFSRVHPGVDLVCTGETSDYRAPSYFAALKRSLSDTGIADRVHILGMIPKSDQIALVKGAIALIQPTLFEGGPGGGAVYDATSLGVRCLLSDIEVNRELAEPGIRFFAAGDAAALARLMDETASQPQGPHRDMAALIELGRARRAACGVQLMAAIDHARICA